VNPKRLVGVLKNNRGLRALWMGETISLFGDYFFDVAIMWIVFQYTHSSLITALVAVFTFIPQVIAGPLLGVLADRLNRRRLMQVASIIQAGATGLLAISFGLHRFAVWEVYATGFVISLANTAYYPARLAVFPDLVDSEDLMTANALFDSSQQIARVVGSSLSGVILMSVGASLTVGLDALSFLAIATLVRSVPVHPFTPSSEDNSSHFMQQLREGGGWILRHRVVLSIITIGALSNIGLGPITVLPPMLIRQAFHGNAAHLGWFDGSLGGGMIVGGLLVGSLRIERVGRFFAAMLGLEGIGLAIVSVSPYFWMAMAGNLVLGGAIVGANIPLNTLFQHIVPIELRGRVFSLAFAVSGIAVPLTYGAAGVFADSVGPRLPYLSGSTLLILSMAIALLVPGLRNFRSATQVPDIKSQQSLS
jgi:MFS family permease